MAVHLRISQWHTADSSKHLCHSKAGSRESVRNEEINSCSSDENSSQHRRDYRNLPNFDRSWKQTIFSLREETKMIRLDLRFMEKAQRRKKIWKNQNYLQSWKNMNQKNGISKMKHERIFIVTHVWEKTSGKKELGINQGQNHQQIIRNCNNKIILIILILNIQVVVF